MLRQFCFEKKIKTLFLWNEGLFSSSYCLSSFIRLLIDWSIIHPTQRTRASDSNATSRSRIWPDTNGTDFKSLPTAYQTIECWVCITSQVSIPKSAHLIFDITDPDWWTSFHSSLTRSRLSDSALFVSIKKGRVCVESDSWDSNTWIGGAELLSADRISSLSVVWDVVLMFSVWPFSPSDSSSSLFCHVASQWTHHNWGRYDSG